MSNKIDLLKQYEIFIQSAEKISDRRIKVNSFFITLNSLLIGFFSIKKDLDIDLIFVLLLNFLGIVFSCLWCRILESFEKLNKTKFDIICDIEKQINFYVYTKEWQTLKNGEKNKYKSFIKIEKKIPVLFVLIYLIYFVYILYDYFCKC